MITEQYVSFETAKLLKEKGFDIPCGEIWVNNRVVRIGNLLSNSQIPLVDDLKFYGQRCNVISAPTQSLVMRWLREVHNICIIIKPCKLTSSDNTEYYYEIQGICPNSNICVVCDVFNHESWLTYEQAAESAIKYCLENLI